jgi:hypothetical protein
MSDYDREANSQYSKIKFAISIHDSPQLWIGGEKTTISVAEANKYEEMIHWQAKLLEQRILTAMG